MTSVKNLFKFVLIAVTLIALGSFALSYAALVDLAAANGVRGWLAYIWPLIVDVSVIVFTAAILVAQLQRRAARLPIALTGFYAIVTITGNVLHAPPTALGWFVASLPPLSLIFATEMLRAMAHHNILQQGAVTSLAELDAQVNTRRTDLAALTAKIDAQMLHFKEIQGNVTSNVAQVDALNDARAQAKQERVNTLLAYLDSNPQANLTEAAAVVDVSRQTVSRYVTELEQAGTLYKNGNGWEVTQ